MWMTDQECRTSVCKEEGGGGGRGKRREWAGLFPSRSLIADS